jgi:hypothetical protein
MKQIVWLPLLLLAAQHVQAQDALSSMFSGGRNVYCHIVLEKANGVDIRARSMPQATIEKAEAEGKQVRPTRTSQYVESYWAFQSDGSFKTFEQYNYGKGPAQATALTYAELEQLFARLPPLAKWNHEADLAVGGTRFSLRAIAADDPAGAGKKGEIELGWLEQAKPVYFYYCLPVVM